MEKNIRNLRIGDVLKEYGYINEAQVEAALAYQKTNQNVRMGGALVELGYITEQQVMEALAQCLSLKLADVSGIDVEIEAVEKIPRPLAEKYEMLAVQQAENVLTVLLNDPLNFYGIEDIKQLTGMQLEIQLCESAPLKNAIRYFYAEVEARNAAKIANKSFDNQEIEELDFQEEGDDETPVINLLNRLVKRAYSTNASDIHIEPFEDQTVVRMRIDGVIM